MRTKIPLIFLCVTFTLLFVVTGIDFMPSSGESCIKTGTHISEVQRVSAFSEIMRLGTPSSYAAEKRFEDYWNEHGNNSENYMGHFNIILHTENPLIKIGVFLALTVIFYLVSWAIFRFVIMKFKSPAKTFVYCFLGFLLLVYASAFICFSEYTMIQAYDKNAPYISQLNWMIILVSFAIWAIFSLVLTYIMRGKA